MLSNLHPWATRPGRTSQAVSRSAPPARSPFLRASSSLPASSESSPPPLRAGRGRPQQYSPWPSPGFMALMLTIGLGSTGLACCLQGHLMSMPPEFSGSPSPAGGLWPPALEFHEGLLRSRTPGRHSAPGPRRMGQSPERRAARRPLLRHRREHGRRTRSSLERPRREEGHAR
jgi:hypothetical protein